MKMTKLLLFILTFAVFTVADFAAKGAPAFSTSARTMRPGISVISPRPITTLAPSPWTGPKQFGTAADEKANAIKVDINGNFHVGGSFNNRSIVSPLWIVVSPDGTITQPELIEAIPNTEVRDLDADDYGVYLLEEGEPSIPHDNIRISKYEYDSVQSKWVRKWFRPFSPAGRDAYVRAFAIRVDQRHGVYYVVGTSFDDIVNNGIDDRAGAADVFIAQFPIPARPSHPSLSMVAFPQNWIRQVGSAEHDAPVSVDVDRDGTAYVAGITRGNLALSMEHSEHGYDGFLMTCNPSARCSNVTTRFAQFGSDDDDYVSDVAVFNTGEAGSATSIYIVGYTDGNFAGISDEFYDMFAIKYIYDPISNSLDEVWRRQYAGSSEYGYHGKFNAVVVGTDGQVYAVGERGRTGSNQWVFFRIDPSDGATVPEWMRAGGPDSLDYGTKLVMDRLNSVFLTGHTRRKVGNNVDRNQGGLDIFVTKP